MYSLNRLKGTVAHVQRDTKENALPAIKAPHKASFYFAKSDE